MRGSYLDDLVTEKLREKDAEITRLKRERQDFIDQINAQRKAISDLTGGLEMAKENEIQAVSLANTWKTTKQKAVEELAGTVGIVEAYRTQLEELQDDARLLRDENDDLSAELTGVRDENAALLKRVKSAERDKKVLEERVVKLQSIAELIEGYKP